MTEINKDLYPIQRFKIMGYLNQVERSNYSSISDFTGLSYSEISRTVKFLEENEYLNTRKVKLGRYPAAAVIRTSVNNTTYLAKQLAPPIFSSDSR